jgi:sulfur carrier protein
MIRINGAETAGYAGRSLLELLEERGYPLGRIAVELNGRILPKAEYGNTRLRDGDALEIVSFVGGG